jgi:hypothetical protein
MVTRLLPALAVGLALAPSALADELPQMVAIDKVADAEPLFKAVEDALKLQGFPAPYVRNVTVPLQTAVGESLKGSPQVVIYPRAVLELCASEMRAGAEKESIRQKLVDEQLKGGFGKRAAAARAEHRCKNVRFESIDKVATPDPHLTPAFTRAHLKEKNLTAVYKMTIRSDGKVDAVQVVQSIPGADQDLIDQVKATWQFKPAPEPQCTVREFSFQIE